MKRSAIRVIIKICAKSILLTAVIGVVIGIIGHINKWNSSVTYSDAFFVAGSLVIIAGASSRFAAGQQIDTFRLLNSESFRNMSSSERSDYIINASSSLSTVILGLLTGILLMLISAIAANIS